MVPPPEIEGTKRGVRIKYSKCCDVTTEFYKRVY
jgi:hypothetical protein